MSNTLPQPTTYNKRSVEELYEELRSLIDGGFGSMTYEDAVEQVKQMSKSTAENSSAQGHLCKRTQSLEIRAPNPEGQTMCVVRWVAETAHGWVGAYERSALEQLQLSHDSGP